MKKRCLVLRIIYELQDLSNCIFFRDLTRLVKKSLQLDKEKKILYFYPHFIPSNLNLTILSKNIRTFNPYFSSSQSHGLPRNLNDSLSIQTSVPTLQKWFLRFLRVDKSSSASFDPWPFITHPHPWPALLLIFLLKNIPNFTQLSLQS